MNSCYFAVHSCKFKVQNKQLFSSKQLLTQGAKLRLYITAVYSCLQLYIFFWLRQKHQKYLSNASFYTASLKWVKYKN